MYGEFIVKPQDDFYIIENQSGQRIALCWNERIAQGVARAVNAHGHLAHLIRRIVDISENGKPGTRFQRINAAIEDAMPALIEAGVVDAAATEEQK